MLEVMRVPEAGLQPQVVTDGATVHLIYFKGDPKAGDLFYARSADGGKTFGPVARVNSQEGSAVATGTIRGGQIALGRNGRVHVAWNGSGKAEPRVNGSSPMLYTRSKPDGAFEPQRNLMTAGFDLDGGGSVAADSQGRVFVAWHAGPIQKDGEGRRRVWLARSSNDGASFSPETVVWTEPTGACSCCQLKPWAQAGRVRLLYRSCSTIEDRDTFLLASDDAGLSFRGAKVHPWKISACPMASYAFSSDGAWAAWESHRQIYWAPVDAAGKAGAIQPAPGHGHNRKHPVLAVNARGDVLLAWTEETAWARGGKVKWQLCDKAWRPLAAGERDGLPAWSMAAVFARPDGGFGLVY